VASFGGIDLGGTKIQAAVVDQDHQVLGSARHPTPTSGGPKDVADQMAAAVREAAEQAGMDAGELEGIGVGSPGVVSEGTVTSARNLPGWEGSFPLAERLHKLLGPPVRLGNDVQVATIAEVELGAGREFQSLLGVFWGTGVGGCPVLERRPWRGRGGAGEIGHMVVELDGARCTCGKRGCMEAYAGRAAMEIHVRKLVDKGEKTDLFKIMKHHDRERLTSGVWARALEKQDALAVKMIDRAVAALAAGVASAVNLLDVEAVILGGGLGVRMGAPMAERLAAEMLPHLFADSRPPHVEVAALGDLGGAIGATLLVAGRGAGAEPASRDVPAAAGD
jgi:glucokinase